MVNLLEGLQNIRIRELGTCQLTGKIPTWLAKLRKLEVLDLSSNQIAGSISGWLGKLPNLFYIDLSDNLISEEFPKQLCWLSSFVSQQLTELVCIPADFELPIFVDFITSSSQKYNGLFNLTPSNNNLSGLIPIEIGQLKLLHVLNISLIYY